METKFWNSARGKMAYLDTGENLPVMLFLHGLPTSKELWNLVYPSFMKQYRCILPDLHNYGESEKQKIHITHKERAELLYEFLITLDVSFFIMVAHDLGSSLAIEFYGIHPEMVSKMVIMSPPIFPDFKEPFIVKMTRLPYLGYLLVNISKRLLFIIGIKRGLENKKNLTPELINAFSDDFKGGVGKRALLLILRWGRPKTVFANYPKIMETINCPLLVIQGRKDPYIPTNQAERLVEIVKGSQLIFVEDGSHFLPIDTPDEVVDIIHKFLKY